MASWFNCWFIGGLQGDFSKCLHEFHMSYIFDQVNCETLIKQKKSIWSKQYLVFGLFSKNMLEFDICTELLSNKNRVAKRMVRRSLTALSGFKIGAHQRFTLPRWHTFPTTIGRNLSEAITSLRALLLLIDNYRTMITNGLFKRTTERAAMVRSINCTTQGKRMANYA